MRLLEFIYYLSILFAAALKSFAVSKIPIQEITAEYIIYSGLLYIFFNYQQLYKKKLMYTMVGYAVVLMISAFFAIPNITLLQFNNSLLFPILFLISAIFFYRQPDKVSYMKYVGIVGLVLAYFNLVRLSTEANLRTTVTLQNNAGNTLVAISPFIFLWRKDRIRIILLVVILLGCLVALKRSGFIIFILICLGYITVRTHKGIFSRSIIYSSLILMILWVVLVNNEDGVLLMDRLENAAEDGGSGRDDLIEHTFHLLSYNDFSDWFFGSGYESFRVDNWKYFNRLNTCAHNDYCEILYGAGAIALIYFISIMVQLWKRVVVLYKQYNKYTLSFLSCFIVLFGASMFVCSFVHIWYYMLLYCLLGCLYSVTLSGYGKD